MTDNQANIVHEMTEQTPETETEKYKIAIMGASGVGKTTFFASYFYLTIDQSCDNLGITPTKPTEPAIKTLIEAFRDGTPIGGTTGSQPIDFNARYSNKEIYISLGDLKGGDTQDTETWDSQDITTNLKDADGIFFFISAEDLINNPEKASSDNGAFSLAIKIIREGTESGLRADIPVAFLYTKSDTIPEDVTLEDLKEANRKLTDYAYDNGDKSVEHYKVSSMEKQNVLEPMEDMILKMRQAKLKHKEETRKAELKRTKRKIAWGLVGFMVICCLAVFIDRIRLNMAISNVETAAAKSDWDATQKTAESFISRLTLLPEILRADNNAFYERYEKAMYAKVQPDIERIDVSKIPSNPRLFLSAADRVEYYLSNTVFSRINARNYENVRKYASYYEAGRVILATDAELSASDSPQEILKTVNTALAGVSEFPEWRDQLTVKIDRAVRAWAIDVFKGAAIDDLRRAIFDAEQLAAHSNMPVELMDFLLKQKAQLELNLNAAWEKLCGEWLQEAGQKNNFEEAVQSLVSRKSEPGLPQEVMERLNNALSQRYDAFVSGALSKGDEEELRNILRQHTNMPAEQMIKIEQRLQALNMEVYASLVAMLNEAQDLNALLANTDKIKEQQKRFPEISREVLGALSRVVDREIYTIQANLGELVSKGDFGAAKENMDKFLGDLLPKLSPLLSNLPGRDDIRQKIDLMGKEEAYKLMNSDFASCKNAFNAVRTRKDIRDIAPVLDKLRGFNTRWSGITPERAETDQVISFLEAIQKGAQATLIIADGDFTAFGSWSLDVPDVFIEIRDGDRLVERFTTIKDRFEPQFNYRHSFTWKPDTVFTFVAMEEDININDEIIRKTIEATGLFGYENLTGNVSGAGNSINIRLEHNIPPCPWR